MALSGPGSFLEKSSVFTVLGIQFWDQVLDKQVTEGLQVMAHLANADYEPVVAFRTASGNYAFQGLPCLHDVEYPGAAAPQSSSPLTTFPFVITVRDVLGRYVPMLFGLDLPLPYNGLFLSNETGSPGAAGHAYVFSAPTRTSQVGIGSIRAELQIKETGQPAAHAAVKVTIDGKQWTGVADDQGSVLVQFPSPLVQKLSLGSPPGSGQGSPMEMSWPVQVEVFCQPAKLRFPLANMADVVAPWDTTPSLKSILDEQQASLVWQTESGPPVPQWSGDFIYGQELVMRTTPADPSKVSSVLTISPGTSSP